MVKEELNSEEKFFEKAVITEKFVKKYKKAMIASIIIVVVIVGANIVYELNEQKRKDVANATLAELQNNAHNAVALTKLETLSPAMHDVWVYAQAIINKDTKKIEQLQDSKALLIADLASYENASASKNIAKLENYELRQNAIYKDLALLQSAVLLLEAGNIETAHEKLSQISINSPLAGISKALMHYGVK